MKQFRVYIDDDMQELYKLVHVLTGKRVKDTIDRHMRDFITRNASKYVDTARKEADEARRLIRKIKAQTLGNEG